ncbi:flagellar motor protein MotB [bacterium]|nr:flagellar motor protein MotB [bacterium]
MPKKGKECPPAGAPAWMTTFADMMTLLLTFFVLLLSFSTIENVKFEAAIASIREGMGYMPKNSGVLQQIKTDKATKNAMHSEESAEMVNQVIEVARELDLLNNIELYHTPEGVRLIISDPVPFGSGSADLQPKFKQLLLGVAEITRSTSFQDIRVEGHTDNVPISTVRYPSNWELSAARALAATKYLAYEGGLDPSRLSAVGYGEYRPRESNDTVGGRSKNRRVEIYLERQSNPYMTKLEQTDE